MNVKSFLKDGLKLLFVLLLFKISLGLLGEDILKASISFTLILLGIFTLNWNSLVHRKSDDSLKEMLIRVFIMMIFYTGAIWLFEVSHYFFIPIVLLAYFGIKIMTTVEFLK